jgi:hypothetical protein
MEQLRQLLQDAFLAGRKDFDKIQSRKKEAFNEWFEENKATFKNINCFRELNPIEITDKSSCSIIRLDKNFHVYIHGSKSMLENCEDRQGKFLKLRYEVAHS